ncbi:hypothetical protein WG78_15135 [Amantichitinum ursilacus]|uniref:peptidylprolyl isomerase n=2 Tax=Amantichitinum ursilacus TaxID=857265 RepID=A0A0N0GML0_9NEIS|nr:hypothetical protein WG78_15135 [Amantichitinum ursilacus]
MMKNNKLVYPLAVVLAVGLLAGCDKKPKAASPSQVLARVNDAEITVHQLNYVLARQPNASDDQKQQVLDKLIDQELLVQKAEKLKLDRDPAVLQSIEQSRRQVLAQAAAEREFGRPAEPSQTQIDDFYNKNPNLFAQRKVYDLEVFAVKTSDVKDDLRKELNDSKSAADTQQILQTHNIQFQHSTTQRAADQLPLNALPQFAAMNPGDISIMPQGDATMLLQLKQATPAPVAEKDASKIIARYLQSDAARTTAADHLKNLRGGAKIEYVKRFASEPASVASGESADDDHNKSGIKGLN